MSASVVRGVAIFIFVAIGIPGMIVSSANGVPGAAISFGLVAAVAAVVLIAVTAVTTGRIPPDARAARTGSAARRDPDGEAEAEVLEERIRLLVADGADEAAVRDLVRATLRLRRSSPA